MNSTKAKYKVSKMMEYTNFFIGLILVFQIILSSIGGSLGTTWTQLNLENSYLEFDKADAKGHTEDDKSPYYLFFKYTGSWILIFCNFVPISLLVTLEMVKFFQGIQMQSDMMMYDEEQDYYMRAQSTNINEEVGQVEFIFSDKTGTLTCNIMEFKKFSTGIAGCNPTSYSATKVPASEKKDDGNQLLEQKESVLRYKDRNELDQIMGQVGTPDENGVREFMMHLAVCHTVVIDKNTGAYNSASPDELALVEGVKDFGYEFVNKDKD